MRPVSLADLVGTNVSSIMESVEFVPESMSVMNALKEMRRQVHAREPRTRSHALLASPETAALLACDMKVCDANCCSGYI